MLEALKEFIEKCILFPKDVESVPKMFKWQHFVCFGFILIFLIISFYIISKKDESGRKKMLKNYAILMLSLEGLRIIWWLLCRYENEYSGIVNFFKAIRFDWCNQVCMIMPIAILMKKEKLYDIIMPMAVIGGLGVMIYPESVFNEYEGLHMASVQSYFSHGLMFLMSILLISSNSLKPKVEHWYRLVIGFAGAIAIAVTMAILLPGSRTNYMTVKESVIPLIKLIPHPWYLLFQFPAMLEGIFIAYFIAILANKRRHKEKKWSKNEKRYALCTSLALFITLIAFYTTSLFI